MRRLAIALVLVTLCWTRPARADIASALYGDIRDVVEELIETEVTTSVVAKLKGKSPALAFYMHGTLERLASPYWGSLGRTLKADLTLLIADFVYWHMSSGGGDGDVVGSAKRFFACAIGTDQAKPECRRLLAAVRDQSRPLLEVECRRMKPRADRRMACDIGLAVRAALEGRGEVRHHLIDALADVVLQEVGDDRGLAERSHDVLARWLDFKKEVPTSLTALFEVIGNPDLGANLEDDKLQTLCKGPDSRKSLLEFIADPSASPHWICFAVTHENLRPALLASVTIREKDSKLGLPNSLSPGYLHAQIEYWLVEPVLKDLDYDRISEEAAARVFLDLAMDAKCPPAAAAGPDEIPCKGVRLAPGAFVNVFWMQRNYTGVVNANGVLEMKTASQHLAPTMHKFQKAMRKISELRAQIPSALAPYLFLAGTANPNTNKMLRSIHRMSRLVTELRARWYLWQSDTKNAIVELDIAELLHVARASLGEDKRGLEALAFLDKHAVGGAASIDIGDWFRFVMRADYRSLAMESLRAALDLRLGDTGRPAETFFLTLASYLLDAGDGVGEEVARSAFRASAKELLLSQSHKGVPRASDRTRFSYLPRLELGLAFNDAYAATDGDTRRNVVAANWPTFMFAFTDYIGLELSGLDLIAPLAEMALRPAGKYDRSSFVALDVFRPRLGTWIAMPQLSRRVALTVGVGARFLDVERIDDGTDVLHARYASKASLAFDAGIQFVF